MKCLNCGIKVPQTQGKKARQFCNDTCRISYRRKSEHQGKSEQVKSEQIKSEQANPNKSEQGQDLSKLSAEEIYNGIDGYQNDEWVVSPEYLKLMKRLNTMSVKDLREAGFSIPNWKASGMTYS